jgi:hypothetical protein
MDVSTDWSKFLRYMTIARASTSMQPGEMLANKAHDSLSTLMPMHLSLFALPTLFLKVGWSAGQNRSQRENLTHCLLLYL